MFKLPFILSENNNDYEVKAQTLESSQGYARFPSLNEENTRDKQCWMGKIPIQSSNRSKISFQENLKPKCYLCGQHGGSMKRSSGPEREWVHIQCALWIPEVTMGDPGVFLTTHIRLFRPLKGLRPLNIYFQAQLLCTI